MKAQISIEFLTGVAIILGLYLGILGLYSHFSQGIMMEKETAKELCYILATAINTCAVGGDGFTANYTIPYKLGRTTDYFFMVLNESTITVDWPDGLYACSIITQNVTTGKIVAGKISINNINDQVIISSIYTEEKEYNLGDSINITGYYFEGNVTLKIEDENGNLVSGYPKILRTTTDGAFQDIFTPSAQGKYKIIAVSINNSNMYAEREIEVK